MNSIFTSPKSISPRSLNVMRDGETRVGVWPLVLVKVAVSSGFAVTVAIALITD